MAFDNTKLSYFHSFSKTPVQDSTSLGNAINKSGHTVTASEVWSQDIPYYGKMGSLVDVTAKVQPYARKNDMCYITAGADKGKTFQYDGEGNWTDITATLIDGALIKNSKDEVVLLYHKGQNLTNLTADNNANTDSADNAARLWASRAKDGTPLPVGETRLIEQFVAPTDKALNGLASVAYAPVIANGSLVSGTDYYDYCFSGTILWATARTAVTPIDCFEYVGDKVSDVVDTVASHASTIATHTSEISELKEKLGIEDDDNPDSPSTPTLGGRVTALEDAVETLNGDATTDGSIAKSIKDAIDGLGDVAEKSDIKIADIKVQIGDGEATSLTPDVNKSVTITIPEVQAATTDVAGVVTISDNDAIATTETTSTAAATVAAVAATRSAIAAEMSALAGTVSSNKTEVDGKISAIEEQLGSTGTTGKAIKDAQDTADEALGLAQTAVQSVTRADGSSDLITVTDGTDVTISLSTEVATKTDAATAASTAITTSLAGTTDDTIGGAISSAVSGLRTELTTGEGSLETRVANLEGSVSEITTTTIPDAITSAKTQTLGTTITTATGKDDETAPKVTVQLSGTVQTPQLTVTTADIASAQALAALETKVDNFHKAGVSYQVLQSLPTASSTYNGVVVLVPASTDDDPTAVAGDYVEHLCVNKGTEESPVWDWERIGTTKADLTQYAKTADLNVTETTANGLTYSQTNGVVSVSVAQASTSQVGTVQLTDTYTATDDTNAATGKSIAAAIATLDATDIGDGAVKVSQTDGIVSSVSVATQALVENGSIKASVTDANALVKAADALEAIKLAAPANYITSINGSTGAKAITIKDGRETVYENDLWGTSVTTDGETITVQGGPIDGTAWGPKNGHNTKGSVSVNGTSYPKGSNTITKVENNMVYNGTTEVANIKTNELVNGSSMFRNTSLTSFSGDLSSLVNGYYMFRDTSLTSFSGDLSSLVNGYWMFYDTSLTSFSGDLSSLVNGEGMFCSTSGSTSLTSFSGDLSSLVNGYRMFCNTSLTSFSGDLSSLVNGYWMFKNTSLTSFSGDLSSLVNGGNMFSYTSLTSFTSDLSSLVNGSSMFRNTSLTSFSGDLSSLVNGEGMFRDTSLTSFSGDLSSLVNGEGMFRNTSLDVESVELICDVLPNYNTENGGKQLQTATWNASGENKGKYTYSDWTSGNYHYPIIKISDNSNSMSQGNIDGIDRSFDTDYIYESNVKTITIMWSDISILSEDDRTAITKLFTDIATEKGWTFITNTELGGTISPNAVMAADGTIQYYILAKKDEATEDNATHIDASGKLWKFDTAEAIIGPNIKYWSMFATVEDALTEWELTPWTKPQEEA